MAKKINKNNTQPKVYEDTGLAEIFLKQEIETPITEVPNIDKPSTKKNKNHTNKIKTNEVEPINNETPDNLGNVDEINIDVDLLIDGLEDNNSNNSQNEEINQVEEVVEEIENENNEFVHKFSFVTTYNGIMIDE